MVAFEFLRAFNAKLDPTSALSSTGGKTKADSKKTAASVKGAVLGRLTGLHSMAAFGLTYAHLSKRSVEQLGVRSTRSFRIKCPLSVPFCVMFAGHSDQYCPDANGFGPELCVHRLPRRPGTSSTINFAWSTFILMNTMQFTIRCCKGYWQTQAAN